MIDWQRIWNDDAYRGISPVRGILYSLSLPYRLIICARNGLYDRRMLSIAHLTRPVISVGNLTVGGTGKTPCVIRLAQILHNRGYRPAIISRGYGGKSKAPVNVVSDGQSVLLDADAAGDEPVLIARSLPGIPVLTGRKRHLAGQAAIERFGVNVLIGDDAFQHRQLHRDIDVVLLDASKPLGNGWLLPAGELREPPQSLRRASCLILTRHNATCPDDPRVAQMAREERLPVYHAVHRFSGLLGPDGSLQPPQSLQGKKVCAFCGIAKPESFKVLLVEAGAEVVAFNPYPDHYVFRRLDIDDLEDQCRRLQADMLITTEKDAMRLAGFPEFFKSLYVVRLEMDIEPAQALEETLLARLAAFSPKETP